MKKIFNLFICFLLVLNCSISSVFATSTESTELDSEENIVEEYDNSEDYSVMLMSEGVTGTELKQKVISQIMAWWLVANNYFTDVVVSKGTECLQSKAWELFNLGTMFSESYKQTVEKIADDYVSKHDTFFEPITVTREQAETVQLGISNFDLIVSQYMVTALPIPIIPYDDEKDIIRVHPLYYHYRN